MRKISLFLLRFVFLSLILLVTPLTVPKRSMSKNLTRSSPPPTDSLKENIITTNSAGVERNLSLSGYSSPFAQIHLSSSVGNINNFTTTNENGFFNFNFIFTSPITGELSLIAEDHDGLASPPTFLPEPSSNNDIKIENVLMPPTLSIFKGKVSSGEVNFASGKTYPNSKVLLYFYSDSKVSLWEKLKDLIISGVWAKTTSRLEVDSDLNGNFAFNLPSTEPANQNLFVAGQFYGSYSPKSFTLSYSTLSLGDKILLGFSWSLDQINLYLKAVVEDPTKVIWLEIPLLIFLTLKVLLRGWIEKVIDQE